MAALSRTPLTDWHAAHGARLVDFAGWEMPVQYTSIVDEHKATRTAASLFDVSHMGRLRFDGPDAAKFLDALLTRKVVGMPAGKVRYSLVCNRAGGILDDVLVYHLTEENGQPFYWLVVNASNRTKIIAWLEEHLSKAGDARYTDHTVATAMIAVQGPLALEIAKTALAIDAAALGYYTATVTRVLGAHAIVSRTGYTGEDGCEIVVPASIASTVWEKLYEVGQPRGLVAAGLGARDTLRLEAAMPLYGHELNENIDPYRAGLGFAVNLKGRDFVGRTALDIAASALDHPVRVGLELASRRVPREHCPILRPGEVPHVIGEVTSGTFSPTFNKSLAMGYVPAEHAIPGTQLLVDIRDKHEWATVVKLPFYKRPE
ncbi:MAG TPA: glycine cleavage system aminomethyltransferase GcvT [Pirellulaceae bacterium]|nr:glycine cleavage system aminomethyltransferase GcvT [Pirellulaceae bacterium]